MMCKPGYRYLVIMISTALLFGCTIKQPMNPVSKIIFSADSGPILPELQWHETTTITIGKVVLVRNGKSDDSQVNAGTWEIPADSQQVELLFDQVGQADCREIRRVEPDDLPDGGGTIRYTVTYETGKPCSLELDPGITYTHSERITAPVDSFIRGLTLPPDAAARIR